VVLEVPSLKK